MTTVRLFCLLFGLALITGPDLPHAQTAGEVITVETPRQLNRALRRARADAVIEVMPGDYGRLDISRDTDAAVIRSADPEAPARFTGAQVAEVDGVTFEGLLFDYDFAPGDQINERRFVFRNVSNTVFRDNIFDGDRARGVSQIDDGFGFGFGLSVWQGENVLIEGNEIFDFWKGLHVRGVDQLIVRGNDVHTIRMDGMNFVQVSDVLVEGNHIHDFNRSLDSADHADMIQFWTNRTEWSSHDIVIRGNLLNAGDGWFTQSIFMRNERSDTTGSDDLSIFYRNILIEENVIINAHTHGISIGDAVGLTIRNNTVVQNPDATPGDPVSGRYTPAIRVAGVNRDVVITNNIAARVVGHEGQGSWQVSGNLEIQSSRSPGTYAAVFTGGAAADPASYRYRADGPAAGTGLGAEMLRSSHSPVDLLP